LHCEDATKFKAVRTGPGLSEQSVQRITSMCFWQMSSENLKDDENQTNPTSASQKENLHEDIQHQDKISSREMVKDWLFTTPCDVMDAFPERSGGTTSADLDAERVSSASSQSRSITSRSSRSSSKRSSVTVKAALAKLCLDQAEERFKREEELRKEAELQEAQEMEESFWKESEERMERRWRQAEKFEEKRRRHTEELEKHLHLIEKRRCEAKRERELELLRLRHWHEAAELKRSILDQLSEGKSNISINHTFPKQEGVSSQFYRSVNVAGQQTAPQRPTYVRKEENVRGNQQGEEVDNVGEYSKGLRDRTCMFSQRYTKQNPTSSHLAQQGSEPRRLEDAPLEPILISNPMVDLPTLVKHLTRPRPQAIFFDGDPMEYWKFVCNFQALVDDKIDDSSAKLPYLLHHCQGKARRLIESCSRKRPVEDYDEAWRLLEANYGRPYMIAHACVKKATEGSQVHHNDTDGLIEFALCLRDCWLTLSEIDECAEMDNTSTLVKVSKRFSPKLLERWKRRVAQITKETQRTPRFKDLVEFVEAEDNIANSPLNKMMEEQRSSGKSFIKGGHCKASSHAVIKDEAIETTEPQMSKCWCCSNPHALEDCRTFRSWEWKDRLKLARKFRLCDNCLRRGHMACQCQRPSACKEAKCSEKHHSLLQPLAKRESQPSTSAQESTESRKKPDREVAETSSGLCSATQTCQGVSMWILPIKVRTNGKEIVANAFFDSGSEVTLYSSSLVERLEVDGSETTSTVTVKVNLQGR